MLNDVMVPPTLTNACWIPFVRRKNKRAGKVAGIVYRKHSGEGRAGNIESCEGATRQEKPVKVAIAGAVVTDYCASVIDASSFGKTHGIVRVNDRRAKATIAEPDKTARSLRSNRRKCLRRRLFR